jgi:hypothetical protein
MSVEARLASFTETERASAFETLGRFIHAVAELDMMVTALLGAITGIGEIGPHELILHSIDLNRKCELLRTLTGAAPDREDLRAVRRIVKFTQRANEKRNIAAHGMLVEHLGKIAMASVTLPRMLSPGAERAIVLVDHLPPITEQASKRSVQANELVEHFERQMPSITDAQRQKVRRQRAL